MAVEKDRQLEHTVDQTAEEEHLGRWVAGEGAKDVEV